MSKPKIAIFVDVQNVYYTCKQAFDAPFNYRKLWQSLSVDYDIEYAFAYAIDSNNDGQHKFQKALRSIGFTVKLKPFIQRSDGSAKGDWDVGIAIDVMDHAQLVDKLFLLSGDGDFDRLLTRVKQDGVCTHVIGIEALTAQSLIRAADEFTPILPNMLLV